jgi:hypothetical protein
MICVGKGRYGVILEHYQIGRDRLIIIKGGEEEHIGSATLIERGDYLHTISKRGHRDDIVSERMAKIIYDNIEEDILVICGIHIDDATKDEIDILVNNAQECVDIFLKEIR